MAEPRIDLLGGDGRRRQGDVHADRAGRAHRVGRVADQERAVPRPVADEQDEGGQREEGREVAEPRREVGEQGVEPSDALGHRGHSLLPPPSPLFLGQDEPHLDLIRVLRQHEERHGAHREIDRPGPVRGGVNDEPDQVEVVVLVLGDEFPQAADGGVSTVGAHGHIGPHLERLAAVAATSDAHHRAPFQDQLRHPGPHPALERGERLRLPRERREKDRLRHPDGVRVFGRDSPEVEAARRLSVDQEPAARQCQVWLVQDIFQEPQHIQQARGARLQHLAAKLAVEVLVTLEDDHLDAALGEQQAEQQAGRAAAHHADVHLHGCHVGSQVDHRARSRLAEGPGDSAWRRREAAAVATGVAVSPRARRAGRTRERCCSRGRAG